MRSGGTGGANTNKSGLNFEDCLRRHENGKDYKINGKTLLYLEKGNLAKHLPKHNYKKNLQPDAAYLDENTKTIYILEMKNQIDTGTVDEKIQTGPFKLKKYAKRYPGYTFYFAYILSEWWYNRREYEDDIEILKESGIEIFWGKMKGNDLVVEMILKGEKIKKIRIHPREYETDFTLIDSWLTRQVPQS